MQPYKRRHRPAGAGVEYMGNNLLQVLQEQQNIIEQQSRLIVDLTATLENWESVAGYDGAELKERALSLQKAERQDLWK